MTIEPRLHRIGAARSYPLAFATISGAHPQGLVSRARHEMGDPGHAVRFAHRGSSPDSDFDLRGAHVLPLERIIVLDVRDETVQDSRVIEGLEMDIVTHNVRMFRGLLLKKNGYVFEQLFSQLIVHTMPEHAELKELCRSSRCEFAHSRPTRGQSRVTSAAGV